MIEDPIHPPTRQQRIRNELARKALLLAARNRRTDHNGQISPADEQAALIEAGFRDAPPPPDPTLRLRHLEAGDEAGLSLSQINTLTGTTPEEITAQVDALREPTPPGDGGARTPVAPKDPLAEAEAAGDWKTSMSIKSQQLIDLKKDQ